MWKTICVMMQFSELLNNIFHLTFPTQTSSEDVECCWLMIMIITNFSAPARAVQYVLSTLATRPNVHITGWGGQLEM